MRDQLLNTDEAARMLGISSATFFRQLTKRSFPFLRTGFDDVNPKGCLYFSKTRLQDKFSWLGEYSPERDSVKKDEIRERKMAYELVIMTLEYEEALIKNTNGKLPREQRDAAADDMCILERKLQPLREKIRRFQKQRLINFFGGRETCTLLFKDSYFDGEYKKLKKQHKLRQEYSQHKIHVLDEKAVEAKKISDEAADKILRQDFARQEKERQRKK